jgi:hypothetical protein
LSITIPIPTVRPPKDIVFIEMSPKYIKLKVLQRATGIAMFIIVDAMKLFIKKYNKMNESNIPCIPLNINLQEIL